MSVLMKTLQCQIQLDTNKANLTPFLWHVFGEIISSCRSQVIDS